MRGLDISTAIEDFSDYELFISIFKDTDGNSRLIEPVFSQIDCIIKQII